MSSIVLELQHDALNRRVPVSDLLRKSLVVARKLGISDMQTWIDTELNGYRGDATIPEYRKVQGEVRAWNPFHGWQPVLFQDAEKEKMIKTRSCVQAVAELESLVKGGEEGDLIMPFSGAAERLLQHAIGMELHVTLFVSHAAIIGILDTVRTAILNWALKLEEDGIRGEGLSFTPDERRAAQENATNVTNFFGTVHAHQVQQGTNPIQVSLSSGLDLEQAQGLVEYLKRALPGLTLTRDAAAEVRGDIETVE